MLKLHRDWLNSVKLQAELKRVGKVSGELVISEHHLDPNRQWKETPSVFAINPDNEFGYEYELTSDGELYGFMQHNTGERVIKVEWDNECCVFFVYILYKHTSKARERKGDTEVRYIHKLKTEYRLDLDYNGNKLGSLPWKASSKQPDQFLAVAKDMVNIHRTFFPETVDQYTKEGIKGERLYHSLYIERVVGEERAEAYRVRYGSHLTDNYKQKLDSGEIFKPSFKYDIDQTKPDTLKVYNSVHPYIILIDIQYHEEHRCFSLQVGRWLNWGVVYRTDVLDLSGKSILRKDLEYISGSEITGYIVDKVDCKGRKLHKLESKYASQNFKAELVKFYKQLYNKFNYEA